MLFNRFIMDATKTSISLTLSPVNLDFLEEMAKQLHISKSALIDKLVYSYKKYRLLQEFSHEASLDSAEDIAFIEADFDDFLKMVNQ